MTAVANKTEPLDTTVTLKRRPNEELIFNDDISRVVFDSLLVLLAPENVVPVAKHLKVHSYLLTLHSRTT